MSARGNLIVKGYGTLATIKGLDTGDIPGNLGQSHDRTITFLGLHP